MDSLQLIQSFDSHLSMYENFAFGSVWGIIVLLLMNVKVVNNSTMCGAVRQLASQ